ncbi:hypothetical protein AMK59_267 [Oryctes borbonicus]|uniref:Protein TsetseEP domain-containing protein n=1 Tax=Oryctes borbonicus TaxID=1629725 RepID=A0A0T6BGV0_9SCAR|nr:hypothetical protein AMK59_267 [Oryctes borbonicus]
MKYRTIMLLRRRTIYVFFYIYQIALGGKPMGIPTQQEQINLLTNVQEVFDNIKMLVNDEGISTVSFVSEDAEKIIRRNQDHLKLAEEIAIIKLSNLENQNCTHQKKTTIKKNTEECLLLLKSCGSTITNEIKDTSSKVTNITSFAMEDGQSFLDSLRNCASISKLQLIQCYRNIISEKVTPLKELLLEAIRSHKSGNLESTLIRSTASDCVDDILRMYKEKVSYLLTEATSCT